MPLCSLFKVALVQQQQPLSAKNLVSLPIAADNSYGQLDPQTDEAAWRLNENFNISL